MDNAYYLNSIFDREVVEKHMIALLKFGHNFENVRTSNIIRKKSAKIKICNFSKNLVGKPIRESVRRIVRQQNYVGCEIVH